MSKTILAMFLVVVSAGCAVEMDEVGRAGDAVRRDCDRGQGVRYVSHSQEQCAAILFLCEAGSEPFFNECGCGCREVSVCDDPGRTYVSRDPDECATIRFFCESGTAFFDDCGCGCESGGGEACGPNTCGAGEVCCNASCGICTPPDGFCTQQACEPI